MKRTLAIIVSLGIGASFVLAQNATQGECEKCGKHGEKRAAHFAKLDTNNDGKLSLDEFKAGAKNPEKADERFKKLDKDGDGFVTKEEMMAGHKKGEKKGEKEAEKE